MIKKLRVAEIKPAHLAIAQHRFTRPGRESEEQRQGAPALDCARELRHGWLPGVCCSIICWCLLCSAHPMSDRISSTTG